MKASTLLCLAPGCSLAITCQGGDPLAGADGVEQTIGDADHLRDRLREVEQRRS